MGGEDGVEPQRLQTLQRRVVADLGGQAHERGGDRIRGILLLGPAVAFAQNAYALVLLGEVHEVEVHSEGAGHFVGAFDRERVGDGRRSLERLR